MSARLGRDISQLITSRRISHQKLKNILDDKKKVGGLRDKKENKAKEEEAKGVRTKTKVGLKRVISQPSPSEISSKTEEDRSEHPSGPSGKRKKKRRKKRKP